MLRRFSPPNMGQGRLKAQFCTGSVMPLLDLREPVNAWSHGAGMMLAVPITWFLWVRCGKPSADSPVQEQSWHASRYQRVKAICLLIFGGSLIACYGISSVFHGVRLGGEILTQLQRLDHVGIFFLIAGTYTPVAWR